MNEKKQHIEELKKELTELLTHLNIRIGQEWDRATGTITDIFTTFQEDLNERIWILETDIIFALADAAEAEVREEDKEVLDRIKAICKSFKEG